MTHDLESRIARAVELFMQGYNCSQSVVAAFADLYGLDETAACRVAAGFGAGVGRMRMMCGAVSGIVILAGLDCGTVVGSDRTGKSDCYRLVQRLVGTFRERNGSVICAELLAMHGTKATDTPEASERNAAYYAQRPCARKVESAARVFAEYLTSKAAVD